MVIVLFFINVKSWSNEKSSTVHLTQGFFEVCVSAFLLIVFLSFLSCFQKWSVKLFSLRVYFHRRVSQCIISGNNLLITFHECSLHHSFFNVCLFSGFIVVAVLHFNSMMLLFYHHKSLFHKSLHQNVKGNELDEQKKYKGESQSLKNYLTKTQNIYSKQETFKISLLLWYELIDML